MKKNTVIEYKNNNYILKKMCGEGGNSQVWEAYCAENSIAVKFLKKGTKIENADRFRSELKFLKQNNHENIVKCLDSGECKIGCNAYSYYVMPLYSGTLDDIIKNKPDAETSLKYIMQLCQAIKCAHDKDIYHRDIKPKNILWDKDNAKVLLADFGIAHIGELNKTKKADRLANFDYHAPEQKIASTLAAGKPADIFTLGLIINQMFTKQIIAGMNYKKVREVNTLYADLDELVNNMIKQHPNERFTIDTVIMQMEIITSKIDWELKMVENNIIANLPLLAPESYIIKAAARSIVVGSRYFYDNSMKNINPNWNCKNRIAYRTSEFLTNLCVQEQILAIIKGKFIAESSRYNDYKPLNLNDSNDENLLNQLVEIIDKYPISDNNYDLSGKIKKYFLCCCDYHCEQILDTIRNREDIELTKDSNFFKNIHAAPILWIAGFLKQELRESLYRLQHDERFKFFNHMNVDWAYTNENFVELEEDDDIRDSIKLEEITKAENILKEFKRLLAHKGITIEFTPKLEDRQYEIYIKIVDYQKLYKAWCLKKSKMEYSHHNQLLVADISDLMRIAVQYDNIVILRWYMSFDIDCSVPKFQQCLVASY